MATIMAVHMTRNIAACATNDWLPMLIHAIDIDHPPGMGMDADIALAVEIVYVQAAIVEDRDAAIGDSRARCTHRTYCTRCT